jgi:hypothetical protein
VPVERIGIGRLGGYAGKNPPALARRQRAARAVDADLLGAGGFLQQLPLVDDR